MASRGSSGSFVLFLMMVTALLGAFYWYSHRNAGPTSGGYLPTGQNPTPVPLPQTQRALMPDPQLTPGDAADVTKDDICTPGYSKKVRNVPSSVKKRVYALYGRQKEQGICCEVDHLISLELGGSNDIRNLWPEPYEPRPGAYEKDKVENYLHRQVCAGTMELADAQKQIATDWYAVYQKLP